MINGGKRNKGRRIRGRRERGRRNRGRRDKGRRNRGRTSISGSGSLKTLKMSRTLRKSLGANSGEDLRKRTFRRKCNVECMIEALN